MRYIFDGPRYRITTAPDGRAALRQLGTSDEPFDVVIVDQRMPELSGTELVAEIKKRGMGCKIIVVSAHLSADICEKYKRLGVHIMFSKPFDVDVLRDAVDRLAA
jgi:two-component system response regulator (stage 0 sporulation protein F)